jgi:hypothetical protein
MRRTGALLPLGLLSAAALALEVLLTKFLAYSVSALLVYVVLGVALLGFGAGGTLTTAFPNWSERADPENRLAWASFGFALSTLSAFVVFVRLTSRLSGFDALTVFAATLLVLPFLAGGTAVAVALKSAGSVRRAYGANLVGSAVGCVIPLVLVGAVGGERLLVVTAALGWLAGALYVRLSKAVNSRLRAVNVGIGALVLVAMVFAEPLYAPEPEPPPLGQLSIVRAAAFPQGISEIELYDRWNATGRIQIFRYEGVPDAPNPYPFLFYAQDSSAGSCLASWDGKGRASSEAPGAPLSIIGHACRETPWGQAYFAPRDRVLVIGLGGGMDVQCALYNGARSVDVVEINPDSIAAVRGPFDGWVGGIGSHPGVRFHLGDGRSFARRTRDTYDVIQLSGVDTKNSASSGGLALSENTLYTVQAFVDYLEHLTPGGVLSIVRFSDAEAVRLSSTATAALRSLGIEQPREHLALFENGYVRSVLVGKSPLTDAAVRSLEQRFRPIPGEPYGVGIFFYESFGMDFRAPSRLAYAPGRPSTGSVADYFSAEAAGTSGGFLSAYEFDATPATDDRPFFFDVFRYRGVGAFALPHVKVLASVLATVLALAAALLLLPALRGGLPRARSLGGRSVFFTAVGLAYLFVEVWLIHTFAIYLGHQTYSLGLVLFALLAASGAGATMSERLEPRRGVLVGVAGIVLTLALGQLVLPSALVGTTALPFVARAALAAVYTSALGAFMGLPFALGLAALRAELERMVPWCIGLNGFASVVATLAVVPMSHAFGYRYVMLSGAGLYLLAALASQLAFTSSSKISMSSSPPKNS